MNCVGCMFGLLDIDLLAWRFCFLCFLDQSVKVLRLLWFRLGIFWVWFVDGWLFFPVFLVVFFLGFLTCCVPPLLKLTFSRLRNFYLLTNFLLCFYISHEVLQT